MTPMSTQIPDWLLQSRLWRYVGFASSVVGLVCYALSSSFNHLFGDWNLLKIFLYSFLSFIICFTILYARKWQHSTSLLFKAHLAVLVLTLTSVYSFFYDKTVNGKPDLYSLISCASFAITSLGLSRQIHVGFEVDLLYFFLGCLIVQLMKIKLLFALGGSGFSYSLIVLRSSLESRSDNENFELQNDIGIQLDASSNGVVLVDSQQADINSAPIMKRFIACIEALQQNNSNLADLISVAKPVTDYNFVIDALPLDTINELQEIVKRMVAAGLSKECSDVYINCRREFLKECLSRLGLRKLSIQAVYKMPWRELVHEIDTWIESIKVTLLILCPSERQLCSRVFYGSSSTADYSVMEVCRKSIAQMLNFADALTIGSRSPERLLTILNMFETTRDLIPEFESLFSDQYSVSLKIKAITIWKRLGGTIRGILMELENMIRYDTAKAAVPGGGIHPITRNVMTYLCAACESLPTLEQVFEDYRFPLEEYPKLDYRVAASSSLSLQMAWIMELLESNLEAMSKIYQDPALSYVFMMNNWNWITQEAKKGKLGTILGDNWIQKSTAKVQLYRAHYQRSSWNKVLDLLKLDSNGSAVPGASAESMKAKLELFNREFEEICSVQSTWLTFSEQLRGEIIFSLEALLLPAYTNFIERLENVPELEKHAYDYIKYEIFYIEEGLDSLLSGFGYGWEDDVSIFQ